MRNGLLFLLSDLGWPKPPSSSSTPGELQSESRSACVRAMQSRGSIVVIADDRTFLAYDQPGRLVQLPLLSVLAPNKRAKSWLAWEIAIGPSRTRCRLR